MSVNDNIKFLENVKQGFEKTISWNKYRSEITTQTKNTMYFHSKNGDNDPTRNCFDEYYMRLVEIKYFNALIDNKPLFDHPLKKNKNHKKNLLKCQEMMTI